MDSWDDDEYEAPSLAKLTLSAPKTAWDDEEEQEEEVAHKGPAPSTEKQIEAARKARDTEAHRIAAAHEAAQQENETSEERRLRERRRVEEADNSLTEELFGGGSSSRSKDLSNSTHSNSAAAAAGLDGIPLKSFQDHAKLALDLKQKLSTSKSDGVTALLKELLSIADTQLSLEEVNELFQAISRVRDTKLVAEQKKKAILKKQADDKKKRVAEQSKKKKHKELFGGDYDNFGNKHDEIAANYEDAYDDFM